MRIFPSLVRVHLAKGLARQFGPNCEVVVHDLSTNDPDSPGVVPEVEGGGLEDFSVLGAGQVAQVVLHLPRPVILWFFTETPFCIPIISYCLTECNGNLRKT